MVPMFDYVPQILFDYRRPQKEEYRDPAQLLLPPNFIKVTPQMLLMDNKTVATIAVTTVS